MIRGSHWNRVAWLALLFVLMPIAAGAGLIGGTSYFTGIGCRFPDVAYDSTDTKYLIVWVDYTYSPSRVFGRFISNSGATIGGIFQISDGTVYALYPTAAYNSTNNEFMVTWDDGRGDRIAGQRVRGSDGVLLGGNFTIGTTSGGRSCIAWSSTSNCYYVVYYRAAGNVDVYGQRVSNTGALLGVERNITNDTAYSGYPAVGYGTSGNQFLVTWDYADFTSGIHGQRIDAATGNTLGGIISVTSGSEDRSSVAYDTVNNRFMVQCNEQGNVGYSYDQYGQIVNSDGSLYGGIIPIAHTTAFEGETLLGCEVAYAGGRFLSIFQLDSNMGGQEVLPSGALPGGPAILGANTGGHGGVAGDTNLGRFLAVWESFEGNYYVRGQVYELNPNPAPGPVTNLVVHPAGGQNTLTWTNPVESDFTATTIRYKTGSYPTSLTDGAFLVDKSGAPGANESLLHSGLTNGVTYYYTVWAHDSTPNYSLIRNSYGTPTAPVCFFDAFSYTDGNLNGRGGWSGSAGSNIAIVNQTVKVTGGLTAEEAVHTTSCGDPGVGYMTVSALIHSGVGTENMWNLYIDDTSNLNLARWYGAGTTARGRIGDSTIVTATQTLTGGWDELKIKINPYANTSEFFFNGTSIGVLDHTSTGAGNTIGRLRFTRGTLSGVDGNYVFFDDLVIGDYSDATAPGLITGFAATAGAAQVTLNWTNPSDSDFVGTVVRCKTTGYPAGPTDGILVCNRTAVAGSHDSYVHSGLGAATYYYAAFSYDRMPNYAAPALASATPGCVAAWMVETFDNYADGNLGGQGTWTKTGAADAQVESAVAKSGKALLADTIASSGAAIADRIDFDPKMSGYHYVTFEVAQDAAVTTGQEIGYISFQSSDGSEIARLHVQKARLMMEYGSGSYSILTTTAANLTFYKVKVGFNTDNRSLDAWLDDVQKTTAVTWKGSGTNLAKIIFGSDRNTSLSPQKMYLDNLFGETKPVQTAQVRDDGSATPSLTKLHFSFDLAPCAGEYRYAIGTTSGGTNVRNWTSCGTATDVMATGLSLADNQTYYVSVQVGTGYGTWGASRTSDGIKVAPAVNIQAAKALPDGASTDVKALRGKLVSLSAIPSGVSPGGFYVQEPTPITPGVSLGGLRIASSASVSPGDQVDICGVMRGSGAERYLDCTGYPVLTSAGPGGPHPVAMSTASVGGIDLNIYTDGVVGGIGPNDIGLLVIVFGRVTQRQTSDPKYFYLDDGCGLRDGTATAGIENVGVRVLYDPVSHPAGSYVSVKGVVSCFDSAGLHPQILPTSIGF